MKLGLTPRCALDGDLEFTQVTIVLPEGQGDNRPFLVQQTLNITRQEIQVYDTEGFNIRFIVLINKGSGTLRGNVRYPPTGEPTEATLKVNLLSTDFNETSFDLAADQARPDFTQPIFQLTGGDYSKQEAQKLEDKNI